MPGMNCWHRLSGFGWSEHRRHRQISYQRGLDEGHLIASPPILHLRESLISSYLSSPRFRVEIVEDEGEMILGPVPIVGWIEHAAMHRSEDATQ